eukprot:3619790-Amphidinium_carterae.1
MRGLQVAQGLSEFVDPALDNDEMEPSAHRLAVRGLSFDTKRKTIRKAFAKHGTVVSVKRYVPGEHRGSPTHSGVFSSTDCEVLLAGQMCPSAQVRTSSAQLISFIGPHSACLRSCRQPFRLWMVSKSTGSR